MDHKKMVWISIFIYIIAFSAMTALRHYNFQTQAGDMATFVHTMWNTVNGRPMQNTLEEIPNTFGVHMSPILYLFAPFYYIFPNPYILLFLQTIALALGAWPLYLLSLKILNNTKISTLIAISYLLYPGLHWANWYDFHPVTFLPPLFFAAMYFAEIKKWGWAGAFFALAAATREDSILIVLFAGIYLLIKNKKSSDKWLSAFVALAALLYFIIATKILMPYFGGGLLRIDRYAELGGNATEIIKNLALHPTLFFETIFATQKMAYLFWIFAPVAFLPLLGWRALIILVPGLAENLLTNYTPQFSGLYQYDTVIVPGIFIAMIEGVSFAANKTSKLITIIAVAAILIFNLRSPLKPVGFPIELFDSNAHWETFREIVRIVPPNISVAANTNLTPHLSNREYIYVLGREPAPVDWVVVDGADYFNFPSPSALEDYVDRYMSSGLYELEVIKDRYFILKKKSPFN